MRTQFIGPGGGPGRPSTRVPLAAIFFNLECKFSLPLVFTQHIFPITKFYDEFFSIMCLKLACVTSISEKQKHPASYIDPDWSRLLRSQAAVSERFSSLSELII